MRALVPRSRRFLSWGIVPGTRRRFDFATRLAGVLETGLVGRGLRFAS